MPAVELPERYQQGYEQPVMEQVTRLLAAGGSVLDVGAGRKPFLPRDQRPDGVTYVGLDISREELDLAGDGYDESYVSDVCTRKSELEGRFDLGVCFQVLEHVQDLPAAIENVRSYLKPGGHFVAQLSGGHAAQALLMRTLPIGASRFLAEKLLKFPPDEVFPAYYDHCTASGLKSAFADWSDAQITSRWIGADYFRFAKPLLRAAIAYEDWAIRGERDNLAPYYVIVAQK